FGGIGCLLLGRVPPTAPGGFPFPARAVSSPARRIRPPASSALARRYAVRAKSPPPRISSERASHRTNFMTLLRSCALRARAVGSPRPVPVRAPREIHPHSPSPARRKQIPSSCQQAVPMALQPSPILLLDSSQFLPLPPAM